MSRFKALLVAVPVVVGVLAAPAAHADWRGHGDHGWHGGGGWHGGYEHGHRGGSGIAGAILGLGAAAIIGGVIASQTYAPPPVVYAPPPAYYPPPAAYYPPPPGYYAAPRPIIRAGTNARCNAVSSASCKSILVFC